MLSNFSGGSTSNYEGSWFLWWVDDEN